MSPTAGKCNRRCPEGEPCILNGKVPHTLHNCKDPNCKCHSSERYNKVKQLEKALGKTA